MTWLVATTEDVEEGMVLIWLAPFVGSGWSDTDTTNDRDSARDGTRHMDVLYK